MIETERNGVIKSTFLGREDHGIPTFVLRIEGYGWGVGFGTYDLRYYGIEPIMKILEVLEVESWEKLPGTPIRVKSRGPGSTIRTIGHFMKDTWLTVEELPEPTATTARSTLDKQAGGC